MLILSRKIGEKIIIMDNIEISILEVKGDSAKIGILAPLNCKVYRKEIYDEILKENKRSLNSKIIKINDINISN